MSEMIVGFGGGCHWCTEAVFQSLLGINQVRQGWIASSGEYQDFSEAVKVHFDPEIITLQTLIEIHLLTHSSQSDHSMRGKYRSAVYFAQHAEEEPVRKAFSEAKKALAVETISKILPLAIFKENEERFLNYYQNKPDAPFCEIYISPKLKLLGERFSENIKSPNQ
ncbi:peptide-methionine (S)-S-oxide reductase [Algoriphagus halophytocola]|uniref:peptide-methionine (S)-S-oxide reductase n=1 Tax=Algoriphagus halophytocola TaxID=2991499 RepID=UPI0022DE8556|nr:peptide-methionine (S)-S-oxide reductase [Algoriphagus sp. TR-M9]WBL44719.1 peptide-methionine (S)-S-oxide reductase [Algoriphagus sp. TR-M9]